MLQNLPYFKSVCSALQKQTLKAVVSPIFRHETCIEKLQMMSSCRPSVDNEAQISNTSREDFSHEVQQIILRIEEAKEKDYVIWHNKIQVYMCYIQGST
jgi:hypothetical protein